MTPVLLKVPNRFTTAKAASTTNDCKKNTDEKRIFILIQNMLLQPWDLD